MDSHTVVTRESWFSRLGDAFKGIVVGLLFVIGGIVLLWWDEGRAITTARGLTEGAGLVISVAADRVEPANEGKLAHVSGLAQTAVQLKDPDFPYMAVKALALRRTVEMYQWQEDKQTKESKKAGGSVVKETTYSYKKVWSSKLNNSANFSQPGGHANPGNIPYTALDLKAKDARLGAFRLPSSMLDLPLNETLRVPENAAMSGNQRSAQGGIYIGKNPDAPEVGDVRMLYSYAPEQDISVVARQQGDSFGPFSVSGGQRSIQMLRPGLYDAAGMFSAAQSDNNVLTWLLRLGGLVALFAGFFLILRPLAVVGDLLPLLGSILGAGAGLAALVLSLVCGLCVIALAWLFFRPVLGVILFVCAAALMVGAKMLLGKRRPQGAAAVTPPAPSK